MKYIVTIKFPIYAPYEYEQLQFQKVLYARNDEEYKVEVDKLNEALKLVSGKVTSVKMEDEND